MPLGSPPVKTPHNPYAETQAEEVQENVGRAAASAWHPTLVPFVRDGKKSAGHQDPEGEGDELLTAKRRYPEPSPKNSQRRVDHGMENIAGNRQADPAKRLVGHDGNKKTIAQYGKQADP
jgi:hypothetical protein